MEKVCKTCGIVFTAASRFNFYCSDCTSKFKSDNELADFEFIKNKFNKKDCIRALPRKRK